MNTGGSPGMAVFDGRAVESTGRRLAAITADDLGRATVNTGWDVRALVAHLVGGNVLYTRLLCGEEVDWRGRDRQEITNPVAQFEESARELAATIAGLDDLARPVTLPSGPVPAASAIAVHATDMLVHGWDLAVATGQDRALDPELCQQAIAIITRFPASTWGDPRFYAERVPTTSESPVDRLVALTGRDPGLPR